VHSSCTSRSKGGWVPSPDSCQTPEGGGLSVGDRGSGTARCPWRPPPPGRARGLARSGEGGEWGEATPPRVAQLGPYRVFTGDLPVVHCTGQAQNGLMRVVATRIEWDGTMQRRVVDTAHCSDGPRWEDLACRALAVPPPYRPVPGTPLYHISLDGDRQVLVAEHDLGGPLLDLVTAVLAIGGEV